MGCMVIRLSTNRKGDVVKIGDDIKIIPLKEKGQLKIIIFAPKDIKISRGSDDGR